VAVIAAAKFEPRGLGNGQRGLGGYRLAVRQPSHAVGSEQSFFGALCHPNITPQLMITDSIYPQLI
jgi:hypothetical protein